MALVKSVGAAMAVSRDKVVSEKYFGTCIAKLHSLFRLW